MANKDNFVREGERNMENILKFIGMIGVVMVVSGVAIGCSARDTTVKDAATQIEVSTETQVDAYDQLPEEVKTGERMPTEEEMTSLVDEEMQKKIESAEKQIVSEAKKYWDLHKEDELLSSIEGGLTYEEFETTYSFYRGALDEVMTPDNAYQLTLIEVNRLFATIGLDYESLDTTKNMTKNSDGTYSYSEQFIGTITSFEYFDGASDEEIEEFLQSIGFLIEDLPGSAVVDFMGMFENGNLHEENKTIQQSEGTVAEENSNSNSGNSNSNSNSVSNSNSSSSGNSGSSGSSGGSADHLFGNLEGNFGGDPGELPEGYTGIH